MQKRKSKKRIPRPDGVLSLTHGATLVTYDPEADAAYFNVQKGKVARTLKLQDWLLADVNKNGALLGIEMLFVSDRIPRKNIKSTLQAGRIPVAI